MDCYVLSSIGELDEQQEYALNMMAPKLSSALGINGSWFDMVATQMKFPPNLPLKIKQIWENGKAKADAAGYSVDPEQFAREFVDTNFPT
ncbi:hypothetical protein [Sphingobium boeckii]|uniref:Aconitase A n=1 Tax=Sphingobium boeckii TaxID=1082345 RepID=A0A7W9ALC7_9SPHN|nr:hypothetical protein [Sphingobium boeckii]MBB5687805.1 aconitase A [Sphingobium boeckii]